MATTRTHGLLIGCFVLFAAATLFFAGMAIFLGRSWPGEELAIVKGGKVGLVVIEGPIVASRETVEEIESNRLDRSVKAVVIRLDSPGGEVAPSQEIYDAVRRLAAEKPVVASFGSVAASGAYYIAAAADSIVAEGGTLTGSIGVIFAYPTLGELLQKIGVEMQIFKSGQLKDMGSFAREPTEVEAQVFDDLIADVFDQFVTAVALGRDLDRDQVLALADGRVFTGRMAVDVGLVDSLGDLYAAIDLAARLGGLSPEPDVVRKHRPRAPIIDLLDHFLRDQARGAWGPRLEYRLR